MASPGQLAAQETSLDEYIYFGFHNRGADHWASRQSGNTDFAVVTTDGPTNPLGDATDPLPDTQTRKVSTDGQTTEDWVLTGPALAVSITDYFNIRGPVYADLLGSQGQLLATLSPGGTEIYVAYDVNDFVHKVRGRGEVEALHSQGNAGGGLTILCEMITASIALDSTAALDGVGGNVITLTANPPSATLDCSLVGIDQGTDPADVPILSPSGMENTIVDAPDAVRQKVISVPRYYWKGTGCFKNCTWKLTGLYKYRDGSETAGSFETEPINFNVVIVGGGSSAPRRRWINKQLEFVDRHAGVVGGYYVITSKLTAPELESLITRGPVTNTFDPRSQYYAVAAAEEEFHQQQFIDPNGTYQAMAYLASNVQAELARGEDNTGFFTMQWPVPGGGVTAAFRQQCRQAYRTAARTFRDDAITNENRRTSAEVRDTSSELRCCLEQEAKEHLEASGAFVSIAPYHMDCAYSRCSPCNSQ